MLLMEPLEVAGLTLRNRVVMPPMGTGLADHDDLSARLEQCTDALAHDLVIVHEEHADR